MHILGLIPQFFSRLGTLLYILSVVFHSGFDDAGAYALFMILVKRFGTSFSLKLNKWKAFVGGNILATAQPIGG